MSCKVFIDGSSGTTGLRIAERLAHRPELELLSIPEAGRKDLETRAEVINAADLAFLCLPDAASREILPRIGGQVKVLDTSTAFRTAPGWVYGFPELHGQREAIRAASRVAVPGCHASGFIALARPLVELGLVPADYPFTCHSLSGYSGGGKKMIAEYEDGGRPALYSTPRAYGLTLHHKHLPEMMAVCGLHTAPVFCPVVADYYAGMETVVQLQRSQLNGDAKDLASVLADYYAGSPVITVHPFDPDNMPGFLPSNALAGKDSMEIFVTASPDGGQIQLISRFDNLGKGSSGAAVQCMNLMLGLDETEGLAL